MSKVVIVGSSSIKTLDWTLPSAISSSILAIVSTLPPGSEVAIRGPRTVGETASLVEEWVQRIASATDRQPVVYRPTCGGREAVFNRDFSLVEHADHVYAYFEPGGVMYGGTGHVVKAALDRHIPVEAWTFNDDGLVLVGSEDGHQPDYASMWEDAQ